MSRVSVVIPVYYNEPNLPTLFERLDGMAAAHPDHDFEFVFVDDGSRDASWSLLSDRQARDPRTRAVKLSRNFGANAAVMAGLSEAGGECVAVIAADLQDPPELIGEMLEPWQQGRKVVLASRAEREDGLATRLVSEAFYALFRRLAIPDMPPGGCDFVLIDRAVVNLLLAIGEKNPYLIGLILWVGFDRAVIPYTRQRRTAGRSRWTLAKRVKYFIDALVAFSYVPMRFVSGLGILLALGGLVFAAIVAGNTLIAGAPIEGWTSLMVVLLIVSGAQLLALGIFGEYLWRNFEEIRKRPSFVVDEVRGRSENRL